MLLAHTLSCEHITLHVCRLCPSFITATGTAALLRSKVHSIVSPHAPVTCHTLHVVLARTLAGEDVTHIGSIDGAGDITHTELTTIRVVCLQVVVAGLTRVTLAA